MKRTSILLVINLFFLNFSAFSQGLVNVDKATGSVQVSIPLYTLSVGNVSLPIGLSYANSGIRGTDIEGSAGIGWNLSAGGAVTRQLRGLPDDIIKDNYTTPHNRTGWISSTNGTTINGMTISNSSNPPVYTNVATDVSFISTHFGDLSDTEPDIFNVSAPGMSLQFVFDKDHTVRTIPYQDVTISYTGYLAGGGGITSFTVTNDRGISYVFSAVESTTRKVIGSTTPAWFSTDYKQYQYGITYASAWKLTQIHDLYNNAININYATGNTQYNTLPVNVYLNGSRTSATSLYTLTQTTASQVLSTVTYQEGGGTGSPVTAFTFSHSTNHADYITRIQGMGRDFQLSYTTNTTSGGYTRQFLSNITDPDCNTPVNYSFSYNSLSALGDSTIDQADYWGYVNHSTYVASQAPRIAINPSNTSYDRYRNSISDDTSPTYPYILAGFGRDPDATKILNGSLSQVNYATGGYTTISYEPNDYYDNVQGFLEQGGGIRVTQISNYDGVNVSPTTVTYSYNDPSTGLSSGKPLSFPAYAFTQAYTNATEADSTKWRKSTVISWSDLSSDDHSIMYSYVRETHGSGAGSTLYQFSVPVTEWDNTTPSGAPSWSQTMTYSGSTTTNSIGYLNNITRSYPFPPSTNYDFERGLPLDITSFDASGNKVSESTYTYNTPQTPVTITAFKYDSNTSAEESYCKYYIYTTAGPLTTQVVNKIFSQSAPTAYRQTTENYYYTSPSHYLLTHSNSTNSDGTQIDKYIKYVNDYTITYTGEPMTTALAYLQSVNVNSPIESYTQVTPPGGSAATVSADLVKYATFTPSGYSLTLPSQHLKIANPNGTTFTPSSINPSGTHNFVNDSQYIPVENELAYDYSGYLLSSDNGFKHRSTVLIDHNSFQPAATIDNTRYDKIAFSDFDSKLPYVNFTSPGTLTTTHRAGQYADSVAASAAFTKTVIRDSLASKYIISAWIRCTGTAGTISATITAGAQNGSGSAPYVLTSNPTTFPTGWQYVEFKVPISTITASSMSISISCNTSVVIDDLWAYPDIAEVSSVAHDPVNFFKTAVTNTNGVASYFSYDKFGRMLYAFDQDKNIVQRKIYASAANETNFNAPAISGTTTPNNHISATWSMATPSYNSCVLAAGVTLTWNFGDGSSNIVTASYYPQSHTYLANGTYTISLTVSSPVYGSKASTYTVTVSNLSQTHITYNNTTTGSSISTVVFKKHSTGVTMYTLTTAQLTAGYNITPDIYDVTITPTGPHYSGGTGYGCVSFTAGSTVDLCFAYTGFAFNATNVDLTYEPNANFGMWTTSSCP